MCWTRDVDERWVDGETTIGALNLQAWAGDDFFASLYLTRMALRTASELRGMVHGRGSGALSASGNDLFVLSNVKIVIMTNMGPMNMLVTKIALLQHTDSSKDTITLTLVKSRTLRTVNSPKNSTMNKSELYVPHQRDHLSEKLSIFFKRC
jgi:hypothetical protein